MMEIVLPEMIVSNDDVLVIGKTFQEHNDNLIKMFLWLRSLVSSWNLINADLFN